MSLNSFGGVLVDTPGDLSVQPMLTSHATLLSRSVFLPGPTTEITLDEDDIFQCGRCKKVFTSFHQFMLHKQEHQIASSTPERLNDSLSFALEEDLNSTLCGTTVIKHEPCLSNSDSLKESCREEFILPQGLRISGDNNANNVLDFNTLSNASNFDEDLAADSGQPLMLNSSDTLNFALGQSILDLNNSDELPVGSFGPTNIPEVESTSLTPKPSCNKDCASSNNVWMQAQQKDDSSNSNFLTSEFSNEQSFFESCAKKVPADDNFRDHNLMSEISYSGDKQMYLNETSLDSEEVSKEETLSACLHSEGMLLQNNKDYLNSCELLEELEKTDQHRLLNSDGIDSSDVMEVEMPHVPSSQMETSLPSLQEEVSPLSPLLDQQQDDNTTSQNCHGSHQDCEGLQEDSSVLTQHCASLQIEFTNEEKDCDSSRCDLLDPDSLLVNDCNTIIECSTLGPNFDDITHPMSLVQKAFLPSKCSLPRENCDVSQSNQSAQMGNCQASIQQDGNGKCELHPKLMYGSQDIHLDESCEAFLHQQCATNDSNNCQDSNFVPQPQHNLDGPFIMKDEDCQEAKKPCDIKDLEMISERPDADQPNVNDSAENNDSFVEDICSFNDQNQFKVCCSKEDDNSGSIKLMLNNVYHTSDPNIPQKTVSEDGFKIKAHGMSAQTVDSRASLKVLPPLNEDIDSLTFGVDSHKLNVLQQKFSCLEDINKTATLNEDFVRPQIDGRSEDTCCTLQHDSRALGIDYTETISDVQKSVCFIQNANEIMLKDTIFVGQGKSLCDGESQCSIKGEIKHVHFLCLDSETILKGSLDASESVHGTNKNCEEALWFSSLDHDYQVVKKNSPIADDVDKCEPENYLCDIKENSLAMDNSLGENFDPSGYENIKTPPKKCNSIDRFNNIHDNALSLNDSRLAQINVNAVELAHDTESCNIFSDMKLSNPDHDLISPELYADNVDSEGVLIEFDSESDPSGAVVRSSSNILIELDSDSTQSGIIFIDNFTGQRTSISLNDCKARVPENLSVSPDTLFDSSSGNNLIRTQSGFEDLGQHSISCDLVCNNSMNCDRVKEKCTVANTKTFESECNKPEDLVDSVSVVYSTYEEESTTFSKLWNPEMKSASDTYQGESDDVGVKDALDAISREPYPLPSRKRKGTRSRSGEAKLLNIQGVPKMLLSSKNSTKEPQSSTLSESANTLQPNILKKPSKLSQPLMTKNSIAFVSLNHSSEVIFKDSINQDDFAIEENSWKSSAIFSGLQIASSETTIAYASSLSEASATPKSSYSFEDDELTCNISTLLPSDSLNKGKLPLLNEDNQAEEDLTAQDGKAADHPHQKSSPALYLPEYAVPDMSQTPFLHSEETLDEAYATIDSSSEEPRLSTDFSVLKKRKSRESIWEPRTPKLTCQYCQKRFAKLFDLRQHLRSHTGEKPFQCIACERSFAQKSNLTKHIRTHKIWPKSVFTLPKTVIQKVSCKKKVEADPNMFNKENVGVKVTSTMAEEEFQSSCARVIPYQKNKGKHDCTEQEVSVTEECVVDNSFLCQFCAASFLSYSELKTHRKIHKDEKVYFCNRKECRKTFPDLESFLIHVRQHEPQEVTHQCQTCSGSFSTISELEHHQKLHSPSSKSTSKRYLAKCPKCKSNFLSQEALDNHLRTVSHDLPCPECKRIFSCERSLRRHLAIHSTVLPFVCTECGKRFKTALYLNSHSAMHRDDKPFVCSQCPAKFARKDRLSRHLRIHSERLPCPFQSHLDCSRVFTRQDKLKVHVMGHLEHESVDCGFCKKQHSKFSAKKGYHNASQQQLIQK